MSKKIYLIDGNSFIYRMFFALPEFTTGDGRTVNATFGMAKFFTGQLVKEKPDYIVFIKDAKGENFRHKIYSDYKATRERMPDSLRSQISDIEHLIGCMNIDIIEEPGYEADDVIATLAQKLKKEQKNEIYILSGDKDLYALVDEQVKVYDTQRKKISGPEETYEKFGVKAECVRDYLAICGDTSDNIPGINGIGPKKAQVLLNYLGTLESIYEAIDKLDEIYTDLPEDVQKILKGKTLEKFIDGKEQAFLSQKLATLEDKVVLPNFDMHDYEFHPTDIFTPELESFFQELEFFSLLKETKVKRDNWESVGKKVQIIGDINGLEELEKKLLQQKEIVLDTETTDLDVFKAKLVGISILIDDDNIFYINFLHKGPQIDGNSGKKFITQLLQSDITIIGHNLKYDLQILQRYIENGYKDEANGQGSDFGQMGLGI